MTKTKFLLAGIILVATTFGAEETKWDFTGSNVEATFTAVDSQSKASYSGKDEDLILKISKKVDDKTTVSFKYDTDDSNPDYIIETIVNRKVNEFVEAQLDLDLITGDSNSSNPQGLRLSEDYDSDKVFIKYTPNKDLAVKFNPFDIGLNVGSFLTTKNEQKTPGIQAEYKLSQSTSIYAGVGTGTYDSGSSLSKIKDKSGKDKTVYGIKAGFTYKAANTSLSGALAMNTQSDSDITSSTAAPLKMATDVMFEQKMGSLTLNAEALISQINKASESSKFASGATITESKTGTAVYAKAKFTLGNNAPYVKAVIADKNAYFKDKDYSALIPSSNVANHGGLTALEFGDEFALKGGLKVIPYIEMKSAKNKIFKNTDGVSGKETKATIVAVKVKLTF